MIEISLCRAAPPMAALATLLAGVAPLAAQDLGVPNIVLVHGAWADGSGWRTIYEELAADGYNVRIVQNPLTSLADDVAATDRVLDRIGGPAILVGHSYGGAVITEAGDHPNVVGLVYVEAFMPDVGESSFSLIPQQDGVEPPFDFTEDEFAFFDEAAYVPGFADSVDPDTAAFMRDSQVPIALEAGMAPNTVAAWREKPSWYQLATADHVIPPDVQRTMAERAGATVVEVEGGHLAFMAHPAETADLIAQAATEVGGTATSN